jgi:hypothetical protein
VPVIVLIGVQARRAPQKAGLPHKIAAVVTDEEMNAQLDAIARREMPIQSIGNGASGIFTVH